MKSPFLNSLIFTISILATAVCSASPATTSDANEDLLTLSQVGAYIRSLSVLELGTKYISIEDPAQRDQVSAFRKEFQTRANDLGPRVAQLSPQNKEIFLKEIWWAVTTPYSLYDTQQATKITVIPNSCNIPANIVVSFQQAAERQLRQVLQDYFYIQSRTTPDGPGRGTRGYAFNEEDIGFQVLNLGNDIRALSKLSLLMSEKQKNKLAALVNQLDREIYTSGAILEVFKYTAFKKGEAANITSQILFQTCEQ
jgi:hypothetical protein